jgi:RNA polymerase sigma-70 factor (ECF subfamily)
LPHGPQLLDPGTVEKLRTGLRLTVLRSLSDPDAAEDVVQETLARGLAALEDARLQTPDKIGAYFRGIARHVIADVLRERGKTVSIGTSAESAASNPRPDALAALISREDKARVVRALGALAPRSRECLRLSFYEGLTPAQIAERLGEPATRVRKRRSRALQHLRAAFFGQTPAAAPVHAAQPGGHDPEPSPTYSEELRSAEVHRGGQDSSDRRGVDER